MSIGLALFLLWVGTVIGSICGYRLSESKWRDNAYKPHRIESGGKLYKVHPGEFIPERGCTPLLRNTRELNDLLQAVYEMRRLRREGTFTQTAVMRVIHAADRWDATRKCR